MSEKPYLVIDGSNLAHRAFQAASLEFEGAGVEVCRIGILSLRTLMQQFSPSKVFVVWDYGRDSQRLALYPAYKKADKEKSVEEKEKIAEYFRQVSEFEKFIQVSGITQYKVKGREADDIIYSLLAHEIVPKGETIVVSTDQDMLQLFSSFDYIKLYQPTKQTIITKAIAEEEIGIPVSWWVKYRALSGDSSDNIPGIKGIGPKKAKKLVDYIRGVGKMPADKQSVGFLRSEIERKDWEKWQEIIRFISVPKDEILAGEILAETNCREVVDKTFAFCKEKGFSWICNQFDDFIQPFILHCRQRKKED